MALGASVSTGRARPKPNCLIGSTCAVGSAAGASFRVIRHGRMQRGISLVPNTAILLPLPPCRGIWPKSTLDQDTVLEEKLETLGGSIPRAVRAPHVLTKGATPTSRLRLYLDFGPIRLLAMRQRVFVPPTCGHYPGRLHKLYWDCRRFSIR